MSNDTTFITNEEDQRLLDRFKTLIRNTDYFDVLVGYFYSSGFFELYEELETTKKIRVLIGMRTDKKITEAVKKVRTEDIKISHTEAKERAGQNLIKEIENAPAKEKVEKGIENFLEWIKSGKLEIRAYPTEKLHAKLYIMTEEDQDVGRVITGSSNFSKSGLKDNLEFNVELESKSDYDFAQKKFKKLWKEGIKVSDVYEENVKKNTWLNDTITPYQLYLKFLYEYFKEDLERGDELTFQYTPEEYKKFDFQKQAVLNAHKILGEYGGVFLADVVGLGKTYMAAMLAQQLDGRNLILAPPKLLETNRPGSWTEVFKGFNVPATFESIGKLDKLLKRGTDEFKNVFVDEAHRFRNQTNLTYERLHRICRGKRVILVTATPYNNEPSDILSQVKLFQKTRKSDIPGMPDLKKFFKKFQKKVEDLDRRENREEYIQKTKEIGQEIREKVLKYLMVRRTRREIEKYFEEDLKDNDMSFPEVEDPKPVFYQFNETEDDVFDKTIKLLAKDFHYARYKLFVPEYYEKELSEFEVTSWKNMGRFMKILLVKRLESSFYAFKKSIDRFIYTYNQFIQAYNEGKVYVSKEHSQQIFEFLGNDDDEAIQRLIDEGKAEEHSSSEFKPKFKKDLEDDLETLKKIRNLWGKITEDPKLKTLKKKLSADKKLQNKVVIFTESKETAEYLYKNLQEDYSGQVLLFTGDSAKSTRRKVNKNFDANARKPQDNYRILVSTEVLSEGVNLHRSNVVINYDIPWNPTRMMQRAGRVNRVDTEYDKIYTYNFFPTKQANTQIKLKELAEAKVRAFISLLGTDARLLTGGEPIKSHELFNQLFSKETITGENQAEQSHLKYLKEIKEIKNQDSDLFQEIKQLPRKARTGRMANNNKNSILTYFRKGKLDKFYLARSGKDPQELDFVEAASLLKANEDTKRESISRDDFYKNLENNKLAFKEATTEEVLPKKRKGGRSSEAQLLKLLKGLLKEGEEQFTEEQASYLKMLVREVKIGGFPKQTAKVAKNDLNKEEVDNPLKMLATLQKRIPKSDLEKELPTESAAQTAGPRKVILSEYFKAKNE